MGMYMHRAPALGERYQNLHVSSLIIPVDVMPGRCPYPHVTDEDPEAPRG